MKNSTPGYLVIFNLKFRVIQGHLSHLNEIFHGCDLIFQGHVYIIFIGNFDPHAI